MEEKDDKIFKFEADDIKGYIRYQMKLFRKMGKSFDYIHAKLVEHKFHKEYKDGDVIQLEKLNYDEGKNYNWVAITSGRVKLILRIYGGHFTIFCRNETDDQIGDTKFTEKRYSAFTFYVNTKRVPEGKSDYYHEHPFEDLNAAMPEIIEKVGSDDVQTFWNSYCLKRPDYCEVENVFDGSNPASIDKLIFCAEELSNQHLSLFAQYDMLDILKTIKDKVGKPFGSKSIVRKVITDFPKEYSDPYYHGVGILIVDEDGKEKFHDVYRLSQWYMNEVENLLK